MEIEDIRVGWGPGYESGLRVQQSFQEHKSPSRVGQQHIAGQSPNQSFPFEPETYDRELSAN